MSISPKILVTLTLVGTFASIMPVAYAQTTQQEKCTLRATVTKAEAQQLAPGDSAITANITSGTVLGPANSTDPLVTLKTNAYGLLCTFGIVKQIADLLFLLIAVLVVAAIVYAGYLFLTSAGDPKKTGDAKNWLTYAIVGMVVAVIARVIPSVAIALLGIG